ncbi:MAG: D-alanine--D-alanine ligase, partial [Bacteroidota bacterium]
MKVWLHKMTHWEYWSTKVVYLPTFIYWLINAVRLRKFFFFRYANPGMKNGGLYGDGKYEIYKQLPAQYYPKTVLLKKGQSVDLTNIIKEEQLEFPLILKPNNGFRGIGVRLVHNLEAINHYLTVAKQDTLLQSLVSYP